MCEHCVNGELPVRIMQLGDGDDAGDIVGQLLSVGIVDNVGTVCLTVNGLAVTVIVPNWYGDRDTVAQTTPQLSSEQNTP